MKQLLQLTDDMLKLAEAGQWDDLMPLERQRHDVMQSYFKDYTGPLDAQNIRHIQNIQSKDKIILRMALSAKDGIRLEMAQAGHVGRAIKAYRKA